MQIVHGGDHWRQQQRHWHLYADEVPVGATVAYEREPDAFAGTPEAVMDWLDKQAPFRFDDAHREIHLAALSWGRSTGVNVDAAGRGVLCLFAHAVGPTPGQTPSTVPDVCARTH